MSRNNLKVLVVDDTIVYRKAVGDVLAEIPGVEVVGVAHNGTLALAKIKRLKPDLITLDIEMPEMNGIEVLQHLRAANAPTDAIMLSTLTTEGCQMTIQCLELGAFDFILKPASGSISESKDKLRSLLTPRIIAYQNQRSVQKVSQLFQNQTPQHSRKISPVHALPSPLPQRTTGSEIVAIGISTGGPKALATVLPMLPGNIGVPILIVQHMPPVFTQSLANNLDKKCSLTVKEAVNGEPLVANTVYIAPGGKQMKITASADGRNRLLSITDDPHENACKPSVDYLFRSVADFFINRITAVIMTGMGSDGSKGLDLLKKKGGYVIGQDEASCVVYGMPKAAVEKNLVDKTVSLQNIAQEIIASIKSTC